MNLVKDIVLMVEYAAILQVVACVKLDIAGHHVNHVYF